MKGVLLINLGSPDDPSIAAVRRYLREFLMDERVVDLSPLARLALVEGCILPFRTRQSARAYASIWTDTGSPLLAHSRNIRDRLRTQLKCPVELGMRYGNPSIDSAIRILTASGATEIRVVPLYPHYAMSSYETAVACALSGMPPGVMYSLVEPFYDHPAYIRALNKLAAGSLDAGFDHLLFSFHGIPLRHLKKRGCSGCYDSPCRGGTCYLSHCLQTVEAFVHSARIPSGKYSVAFQSRLGRDKWLEPCTDQEINRLARLGVKNLAVICPAFITDCLETLEEIGIRGRESFLRAGGTELKLIPCLNDHPAFIDALEALIEPLSFARRPGDGAGCSAAVHR